MAKEILFFAYHITSFCNHIYVLVQLFWKLFYNLLFYITEIPVISTTVNLTKTLKSLKTLSMMQREELESTSNERKEKRQSSSGDMTLSFTMVS